MKIFRTFWGVLPITDYYGEAPPERGTFFRLQVDERVGIAPVKVYIDRSQSLVFRKVVKIERFALPAAILDECQNYLVLTLIQDGCP